MITAARERTIPVPQAFVDVFPEAALQRGSTVFTTGVAATSLAFCLVSSISQAGGWVGAAGFTDLGLAAAVECGVALERLVAVRPPTESTWTTEQCGDVAAALIDGFDMVVIGQGMFRLRATTARRLQARAHAKGAVLIAVGGHEAFVSDLCLHGDAVRWAGLGDGHGVATARHVDVVLSGRRVPRSRRSTVWLPNAAGQVARVDTVADPVVVPLRQTG